MDYKEVLELRKQQLESEVKILKDNIEHHGGKGRIRIV